MSLNLVLIAALVTRAAALSPASTSAVSTAIERCRVATQEGSKTFYFATNFMDRERAEAVWSIYAWCREVDEVADGPGFASDDLRRAELERRRARLDATFGGGGGDAAESSTELALASACARFALSKEPFNDMIDGMLMDLRAEGGAEGEGEGGGGARVLYETAEELDVYCYRVAGTVGLMTLPIVGGVDRAADAETRARARALGEALQLTNILRDVGEDATERGRVYLPRAHLARFGVGADDIVAMSRGERPISDAYRRLVDFELARNLERYADGEAGVPLLPAATQLPVRVALELYREIALSIVARNGHDNLTQRAFVGTWSKVRALPGITARAVRAALAAGSRR